MLRMTGFDCITVYLVNSYVGTLLLVFLFVADNF